MVDVDSILAALDQDQITVLATIARIQKTRDGYFAEGALERKHACRDLNVRAVLKQLQDLELVQHVSISKQLWNVTHDGKLVEHACLERERACRYPGLHFR